MERELADKLTKIPQDEFIAEAAIAWKRFYGQSPHPEQLACCLAQMVLETGRDKDPSRPGKYLWGKFAHNHNWGNIKSRPGDGQAFQFYACGEEVSLEEALKQQSEHPGLVEIRKRYTWTNGAKRASVWLKPPHPWTRFRAYETLLDGLRGYLRFLVTDRTRYSKAWNRGVLVGDVVKFSMLLGEAGYYTADPARYTRTMVQLFEEFLPEVKEAVEPLRNAEQKAADSEALKILANHVWQSYRASYPGSEKPLEEDEASFSIAANRPDSV